MAGLLSPRNPPNRLRTVTSTPAPSASTVMATGSELIIGRR